MYVDLPNTDGNSKPIDEGATSQLRIDQRAKLTIEEHTNLTIIKRQRILHEQLEEETSCSNAARTLLNTVSRKLSGSICPQLECPSPLCDLVATLAKMTCWNNSSRL